MKNLLLGTGFAAALLSLGLANPTPALAGNETDVATITCKVLLTSSKDDAGTIMIWLHGFYAGKSDDTTFNLDDFGKSAEQMGVYCTDHPDVSILSAAKTVFGG